MYEDIREDVLVYFLTEFPVDHPVAYVELIVKEFLRVTVGDERAERFWVTMGESVIQDMIQEFNRRLELGLPLRYEPMDDVGEKIRGRSHTDEELAQATFQEALISISDTQFEQLSARILQWVGCTAFWSTPASHDEGLDAFGLMCLDLPAGNDPDAIFPAVCMLAQAKHYSKEKLRTGHVRELVGSGVLAKHGVYSTVAPKYSDLDMRPFAPTAFFLMCSGEVTRTTRGLARGAGVFLITSCEIFEMYRRHWAGKGVAVPNSVALMKRLLLKELSGIPVAA